MTFSWPLISPGSIVDIIAPSGRFDASAIPLIKAYIESIGLQARIPETILGEHLFCAQKDQLRFLHLQQALQAKDSTLIWSVRGGYGTTRIMPELMQCAKPAQQKLLVGFSDITTLHLWVNQAWQWPSLHGPTAQQVATGFSDAHDIAALKALWFKGLAGYQLAPLQPLNFLAKTEEKITGITAGTCLSLIQASLATPWQIDTRNKILLLEDVNELPYRLDRLLVHLANAGIFSDAAAVIFADFTDACANQYALTYETLLTEFVLEYLPKLKINIPVFRMAGLGHGKRNQPLPLGVSAYIKNNTLNF